MERGRQHSFSHSTDVGENLTPPVAGEGPSVPTATSHGSSVGPDKGGSRLERSLAGRVGHDQESGLGLAWRPTGPDVRPTNSVPARVSRQFALMNVMVLSFWLPIFGVIFCAPVGS